MSFQLSLEGWQRLSESNIIGKRIHRPRQVLIAVLVVQAVKVRFLHSKLISP